MSRTKILNADQNDDDQNCGAQSATARKTAAKTAALPRSRRLVLAPQRPSPLKRRRPARPKQQEPVVSPAIEELTPEPREAAAPPPAPSHAKPAPPKPAADAFGFHADHRKASRSGETAPQPRHRRSLPKPVDRSRFADRSANAEAETPALRTGGEALLSPADFQHPRSAAGAGTGRAAATSARSARAG